MWRRRGFEAHHKAVNTTDHSDGVTTLQFVKINIKSLTAEVINCSITLLTENKQ